MTEQEEFEFRLRLEQEQKAQPKAVQPPPKESSILPDFVSKEVQAVKVAKDMSSQLTSTLNQETSANKTGK